MKKLLSLLVLLFFTISLAGVYAQEEEPSPTPSSTVPDKIQELKDRVASRVAALKKEKVGGLLGSVKSTSDSALILIYKDNEYSVQLDEDAKVYSIDLSFRKKEIKLSSLEKDQTVTVIGSVDNDEKSAVAKVVVFREPSLAISGRIASVSTKDGTVTVVGNDEKTYIVDIEITTKSNTYDFQKETLSKIGLSKIAEGARIHVYGTKGEEENRVTATRILILPEPTTSQPTSQPISEPTKTPTPTKSE